MKKLFVVFICFVLFGCSSPDRVVNDAPFIERSGQEKMAISKQFFTDGSLKLISMVEHQDFNTIHEWYDDNTVIYSVSENGMSTVYLHYLYTGERALFYQTTEFISKIEANSDHSLFAIQTLEQSGVSHLRILNKMGGEVFSWSNKIEDLQFMWNPYVQDQLILTEFLTYLEFQLLTIDVKSKDVKKLPVNNPFVQWTSQDEIGYLNWNQNEPSLEAPLLVFNINTMKEEKWLDNCILLFSLKNIIVTVSIDQSDLNKSVYTFYDSKTRKKLTEIFIPVLNTFSEAWWMPSYDFNDEKKLFYYLKPNRAGDITEYNEGYQLTVLSIDENKEEVLTSIPSNFPIKLSPDGNWCLVGQQLEQLLNVTNKQMTSLVSN